MERERQGERAHASAREKDTEGEAQEEEGVDGMYYVGRQVV